MNRSQQVDIMKEINDDEFTNYIEDQKTIENARKE